jgi:putative SOS response-associated peptidase YedK
MRLLGGLLSPIRGRLGVGQPGVEDGHLGGVTVPESSSSVQDDGDGRRSLARHQEWNSTSLTDARRRCLVPAPIYYEWRDDPDGKTPFAVARVDGDPVAFGGIWEAWRSPEGERLQTLATITTDANELLAPIQDRMPVIIEKADRPVWLGEAEGDPAALLRPAPNDVLRVWQVDKKVGNVRNDAPDLIKPIAKLEPTLF